MKTIELINSYLNDSVIDFKESLLKYKDYHISRFNDFSFGAITVSYDSEERRLAIEESYKAISVILDKDKPYIFNLKDENKLIILGLKHESQKRKHPLIWFFSSYDYNFDKIKIVIEERINSVDSLAEIRGLLKQIFIELNKSNKEDEFNDVIFQKVSSWVQQLNSSKEEMKSFHSISHYIIKKELKKISRPFKEKDGNLNLNKNYDYLFVKYALKNEWVNDQFISENLKTTNWDNKLKMQILSLLL